jgi:Tfp pilus assembly protein PilO
MKKICVYVLLSTLYLGLIFIFAQSSFNAKIYQKQEEKTSLSNIYKINSKYKIVNLPIPKTDFNKYKINKLPEKLGKVEIKFLNSSVNNKG